MVKRSVCMLVCVLGLCAGTVVADPSFVVDSAPNTYGSADWAPWWADAKADLTAGTFINLRSAIAPTGAELKVDPYDEIVYSTGDLGRRLHWIYWVPGETPTSLAGKFEVKWVIDWGGNEWTYEGGGWAANSATAGWSQPQKWEEYTAADGTTGVIGSLGFAWWSTDDDALPGNTGGSAYDEVDQADIDALRDSILASQTFATGHYRISDGQGGWTEQSLQVDIVPAPGAAVLGALGLGIVGYFRRKAMRD